MSIGKEEPIKDELGGAKYMLVRAENLRRKPDIEKYHDMIRFTSERLYKEMNGKEPNYPYEYAEAFDNFFVDSPTPNTNILGFNSLISGVLKFIVMLPPLVI